MELRGSKGLATSQGIFDDLGESQRGRYNVDDVKL
jgi:hypothetical protein